MSGIERLGLFKDALNLGPRRLRSPLRRRATEEQERAASEQPPLPGPKGGLSAQVPSALIPLEQRAAALIIGGPPAWSRRLRRIDTLTEALLAELEVSWRQLARKHRREPEAFARAWRARAAQTDFSRINDLIARHNLHFPAEANLAMDVRTGEYIGIGGGDYRRTPLDAAWVLERFPPDLALALAGA